MERFILNNGELYFRGSGGVLARAISKAEAKEELKRVHNLYCGDNNITIYRRLQKR